MTPIRSNLFLLLLIGACTGGDGSFEERRPLSKSDAVGSCASSDQGDFCGTQSNGNCWCDELCDRIGDCCADVEAVCTADPPIEDACADLDLPPCPAECPTDAFASCGTPCDNEGETCGNSIGDGRTCQNGIWQCTVHPPLGMGCNLVCQPDPECESCDPIEVCPSSCGEYCAMAAECTLPGTCENPGCGCPIVGCD